MEGGFSDSKSEEYSLNNEDDFQLSVSLKKQDNPAPAQDRLKKLQDQDRKEKREAEVKRLADEEMKRI